MTIIHADDQEIACHLWTEKQKTNVTPFPHLSIVIIHAIVLRNLIKAKNCGDILLDSASWHTLSVISYRYIILII